MLEAREVDRRLREAFDPAVEEAARAVRGALDRRSPRAASAVVLTASLSAAALAWALAVAVLDPAEPPRAAEGHAEVAAPAEARERPATRIVVGSNGPRSDSEPPHQIIIYRRVAP